MADFAPLLRQRRIAPMDSPLGMPSFNTSDPFEGVMALAEEAKGQDLRRRKELMQFESDLAQREQGPARMQAIIERGRQLNPANKKYVLGAGSGSGQLKPSTVERDNAANDAKAAAINEDFANINLKRDELRAGRESEERIANRKVDAVAAENANERAFKSKEDEATRKFQGEQKDLDRENARVVAGIRTPDKGTNARTVADIGSRAQEALDEIKNILDDKGNLTEKGKSAVGWSSFLKHVPGTQARSGDASIRRVASQQVLNVIAELKAQSRTGATGFGNMSNKDLATLESAAHKLDTLQSEPDFAAEMNRIRAGMQKIVDGAAAHAASEAKDPNNKRRLNAQEMMKKHGY